MTPNRNLRIHNAHILWSPLSTIMCPYCTRHFRNRGGHTKHIRAHHDAESHARNPSVSPSAISYLSSRPSSPIPSNYMLPPSLHPSSLLPPPLPPSPLPSSPLPSSPSPSPPPLPLPSPSDYLPPPFYGGVEIAALNSDAEDDLDAASGMNSPQASDALSIKHYYHPKLNGRVDFFRGYTNTKITCRADL